VTCFGGDCFQCLTVTTCPSMYKVLPCRNALVLVPSGSSKEIEMEEDEPGL
jgi:hypothetical protein